MSRRKLMLLSFGALLLGLLAYGMVREAQVFALESRRADHRDRVLTIVEELRARVKNREDAGKFTLYGLIGAAEGAKLSVYGDFALNLQGQPPSHAGTTVTFGAPDAAEITLTVKDLSAGEWTIEETELPSWWEVWK